MKLSNLYSDYINGKCVEVWKEISFVDYAMLSDSEQETIDEIMKETIERINYNVKVVYSIFQQYGFEYKNFGNINTINKPYLLRASKNYIKDIEFFYRNKSTDVTAPLFFAAFCSFFKVIDFRGTFEFETFLFLDPLFIESFNSHQEVEELIFERQYNDNVVKCSMFSPDQYIKEDESGDLGACILLSESLVIDNYVVNYHDDFNFTFIEYLRFCFEWGCLPSLFWASETERIPYLPILEKIRQKLKPF